MRSLALMGLFVLGCQSAEPATGAVAGAITCSFYYRASNEIQPGQAPGDPAFDFVEESVTVQPNEFGSIVLADLKFSANFMAPETEVRGFVLTVEAGSTRVFQSTYQIAPDELPANQFSGDHGFTGLMYLTHPELGGDYQVICGSLES